MPAGCTAGAQLTSRAPVVSNTSSKARNSVLRVAQVDRVEVEPEIAPEVPQQSSLNGTSGNGRKLVEPASTTSTTSVRPVAPAATAVGLVGQAASESVDRPFIPVIDFQELADTLLGDPEVVLRDKTLYGEPVAPTVLLVMCACWPQVFYAVEVQSNSCGSAIAVLSCTLTAPQDRNLFQALKVQCSKCVKGSHLISPPCIPCP